MVLVQYRIRLQSNCWLRLQSLEGSFQEGTYVAVSRRLQFFATWDPPLGSVSVLMMWQLALSRISDLREWASSMPQYLSEVASLLLFSIHSKWVIKSSSHSRGEESGSTFWKESQLVDILNHRGMFNFISMFLLKKLENIPPQKKEEITIQWIMSLQSLKYVNFLKL